MRGLMMDSPLTLAALLRHTSRVHPRREIVSRGADRSLHRYTYSECLDRARRLGSALRALGLRPGDRVATLAWNDHRHLEAYYGVPASGFVLHTLNVRLHPDDLAHIANDAGDKVAILAESLPRTPTGKLRKLDLRAAYANHYSASRTASAQTVGALEPALPHPTVSR